MTAKEQLHELINEFSNEDAEVVLLVLERRHGPTGDSSRSPAAKVMDEAIDLAIEGRSPFPERAAFIDADAPSAGHDIERAVDEGLAIVLVSVDGSIRVLNAGAAEALIDDPRRRGLFGRIACTRR